jgi:uncharacterized membrane protein
MFLTRRGLLGAVDADALKEAIREAETRTSGEIRVSVSTWFWGDVRRAAEKAFDRLGMKATRDRNGVLFFVVPSRRRFVVLGDEGIHAKVGPEFWEKVAAAVSGHFRAGEFTAGLRKGIETVGQELAAAFPYDRGADVNELADDIDAR